MKEICLSVLSYVLIAILLIIGAFDEFKRGNKFVGIVTGIVALLMIWNAIENTKKLNNGFTK